MGALTVDGVVAGRRKKPAKPGDPTTHEARIYKGNGGNGGDHADGNGGNGGNGGDDGGGKGPPPETKVTRLTIEDVVKLDVLRAMRAEESIAVTFRKVFGPLLDSALAEKGEAFLPPRRPKPSPPTPPPAASG